MGQCILSLTISNFFPKEKEKKFKQECGPRNSVRQWNLWSKNVVYQNWPKTEQPLVFEVHKLVRLLDLESPKPLVGEVDNPSRFWSCPSVIHS